MILSRALTPSENWFDSDSSVLFLIAETVRVVRETVVREAVKSVWGTYLCCDESIYPWDSRTQFRKFKS